LPCRPRLQLSRSARAPVSMHTITVAKNSRSCGHASLFVEADGTQVPQRPEPPGGEIARRFPAGAPEKAKSRTLVKRIVDRWHQGNVCFGGDEAMPRQRSMSGLRPTPAVPRATPVRALSAQLRRPRPHSATTAPRRLRSYVVGSPRASEQAPRVRTGLAERRYRGTASIGLGPGRSWRAWHIPCAFFAVWVLVHAHVPARTRSSLARRSYGRRAPAR